MARLREAIGGRVAVEPSRASPARFHDDRRGSHMNYLVAVLLPVVFFGLSS